MHVYGEPPAATTLMLWLMRHLSRSCSKTPRAEGCPWGRALRWAASTAYRSCPGAPGPPPPAGVLRPALEAAVLRRAQPRTRRISGRRSTWCSSSSGRPTCPRPGRDALRLYCAPVVNCGRHGGSLAPGDPGRKHLLRTAGSTRTMESHGRHGDGRAQARSSGASRAFFDFTHAAQGPRTPATTLRRRRSSQTTRSTPTWRADARLAPVPGGDPVGRRHLPTAGCPRACASATIGAHRVVAGRPSSATSARSLAGAPAAGLRAALAAALAPVAHQRSLAWSAALLGPF
jgi:hypothetical protein